MNKGGIHNLALQNGGTMFSENLNRILKEKQITHYRLAKIAGITHPTMSLYRNAKRMPGIVNLKKIAEALSVSTDELIKI